LGLEGAGVVGVGVEFLFKKKKEEERRKRRSVFGKRPRGAGISRDLLLHNNIFSSQIWKIPLINRMESVSGGWLGQGSGERSLERGEGRDLEKSASWAKKKKEKKRKGGRQKKREKNREEEEKEEGDKEGRGRVEDENLTPMGAIVSGLCEER